MNEQLKKSIERVLGISFDKLVSMNPDDETEFVEKKIGKKLVYPYMPRTTTPEELERKIKKIN